MPETVLEQHYRDRVQSVRQIAQRQMGQVALAPRDLEDLVALCLELSVSGRELLEKEYKRIFKEHPVTVSWLLERRHAIEELSDDYLQLVQSVRASALRALQAAGAPPGNDFLARLDAAIQAITEARQSVLERWLVGSEEEIRAAGANWAEGLDLDEAFARIAGVDVEAWRRRVEESNRRLDQ